MAAGGLLICVSESEQLAQGLASFYQGHPSHDINSVGEECYPGHDVRHLFISVQIEVLVCFHIVA